jgi:hypothetical protein
MTSFSPFDKRLLEEGLAYFDRPRLAGPRERYSRSAERRAQRRRSS